MCFPARNKIKFLIYYLFSERVTYVIVMLYEGIATYLDRCLIGNWMQWMQCYMGDVTSPAMISSSFRPPWFPIMQHELGVFRLLRWTASHFAHSNFCIHCVHCIHPTYVALWVTMTDRIQLYMSLRHLLHRLHGEDRTAPSTGQAAVTYQSQEIF